MTDGDAWWVVGEVRKPGKGQEQESGLAAILGSAIGYACDFAVSYKVMRDKDLPLYDWSPALPPGWTGSTTAQHLEEHQISPVLLRFDKGRDGPREVKSRWRSCGPGTFSLRSKLNDDGPRAAEAIDGSERQRRPRRIMLFLNSRPFPTAQRVLTSKT